MCPKGLNRQSGSMLVIAIFVIVVMSILGVAMVRLTSTASQTLVTEVYGLRALNAARAGINEILLQEFPHNGSTGSCSPLSRNLGGTLGLENCQYSAVCEITAGTVTIAGTARNIVRFQSTGSCTAGEFIVNRTISLEAVRDDDS